MTDLIPMEFLIGAIVLAALAVGVGALWYRFVRRGKDQDVNSNSS